MENYYEILQCPMDASLELLKSSYQNLIRTCHPDKLMQQGASESEAQQKAGEFSRIDKAWKVLSDAALRKEYDARWQQRCVAQKWPVQDDVEFEDFSEEDAGDDDEEESCFYYDCRCGGQHVLTQSDVTFKVDFVPCESCSLCIRVIYNDDDS